MKLKSETNGLPGYSQTVPPARHLIYFHPIVVSNTPTNGTGSWSLQYKVLVPGTFHRCVYCAACGDVHRHDLIGQPCRNCDKQVGPHENIRVEKYWHGPHYRGPEDVETRDHVRVIGGN